jgi:hypothetical protein
VKSLVMTGGGEVPPWSAVPPPPGPGRAARSPASHRVLTARPSSPMPRTRAPNEGLPYLTSSTCSQTGPSFATSSSRPHGASLPKALATLHDAQLAIPRKHGHSSWTALKEYIPAPTNRAELAAGHGGSPFTQASSAAAPGSPGCRFVRMAAASPQTPTPARYAPRTSMISSPNGATTLTSTASVPRAACRATMAARPKYLAMSRRRTWSRRGAWRRVPAALAAISWRRSAGTGWNVQPASAAS